MPETGVGPALDPDPGRCSIRAMTGLDFGSEDDFSAQFGVFGEVGVKVPIEGGLGARLGVGGARFFENSPDFQDVWSIFGTMGFSYFTG